MAKYWSHEYKDVHCQQFYSTVDTDEVTEYIENPNRVQHIWETHLIKTYID